MLHLCIIFCACFTTGAPEIGNGKFPDDFLFGVATASYQVEGAWNASGKGENIWDRFTHDHPNWITDRSNGDIACDSYHKYKEDVKLLSELGVHFYRFSLSWSRLLPSGYANHVNADGVRYYNALIDELLAHNITPVVTLYHWDLPQPLQEIGGWPNPLLADYYVDYARVVFQTFGDRVKTWISFNEPPEVCQSAYGDGYMAPAYHSDGIGTYMCGRTLLLAHARTYRLYKQQFKPTQHGKLGITIDARWYEPATNSTEDRAAAEKCMQMTLGWWAHPIFSQSGDYPDIMKESIKRNSKEESFPRSRLIPFAKEEVKLVQGTFDFFGLNHYTSSLAAAENATNSIRPSFARDIGVRMYQDPKWPSSAAKWLRVVPWGFRKLLHWIKNEYNNPEVLITENGFGDLGELIDMDRTRYMLEYLQALLDAIQLDKCNVKGYTFWSLIDNFEWRDGYTVRFGLYHVDFRTPNRTRTSKHSSNVYAFIVKNKVLQPIPPTVNMPITGK